MLPNIPDGHLRATKYLYSVLMIALLYAIYWSTFQINSYNTFHLTEDAAYPAYSMYYYLHFPVPNALQYLVFDQHIAVDQLMLLPFYALFQSVLILMISKVLILTATGLLIFIIAKNLLKSEWIALAFAIAFFLNPGVNGILISDYTPDFLIIPFFISVFYFYMKDKESGFYISLLLLLGTCESVLPVVGMLAVGLLGYEYLYSGNKHRLHLAYSILPILFIALFLYNAVASSLLATYAHVSLSPILQYIPFPLVPLGANTGSFNMAFLYQAPWAFNNIIYAILLVLFGFGIAWLYSPAPSLLLEIPWFAGAFILLDGWFVYLHEWMFSFVIGACVVGAILGASEFLRRHKPIPNVIPISAIAFSLALFLSSYSILSTWSIVSPAKTVFFFLPNQSEIKNYEQVGSMMSLIPSNASLMIQGDFLPYAYQRQYVEELSNNTYFFLPEYIFADFDINVSLGIEQIPSLKFFSNFINAHLGRYVPVPHVGSSHLLRLIS